MTEQRLIIYTENIGLDGTYFKKIGLIDGDDKTAKRDLSQKIFNAFDVDDSLKKIIIMRSKIEEHLTT